MTRSWKLRSGRMRRGGFVRRCSSWCPELSRAAVVPDRAARQPACVRRTRAPAASTGRAPAPARRPRGPGPQAGAGARRTVARTRRRSWLVDESVAEGEENGLELRVDAELVEDACDVVALGADADPEPV